MLYVEERNLGIPRDKMARATRLIPFDGKPDTAFRSPLTLDMVRDVSALYAHTQVVLLVDETTVHILRTYTFQTSPDGCE